MVQHQKSIENGANGLPRRGDGVWPPQDSLRARKPLLGGRKIIGGPSTPVPRWKLYDNPFYDGIAAAAHQKSSHGGAGGREVVVSARKLAATLWELQEFPFPLACVSNKSSSCLCIQKASAAAKKSRYHILSLADMNATTTLCPSFCESGPHPPCFHSQQAAIAKKSMVSLRHPTKAWENVRKSSLSQSTSNRQVAAMRSHVHRLLERKADAKLSQFGQGNPGSCMVLNRIGYMQEQEAAATLSSMVAALRIELDRARARTHELELAHKSAQREVEIVLKKIAEEKVIWRNKEQENIRSAVQALKMEAAEEKRARQRVESISRKTSRELLDSNIAVARALQELQRERKARELMEDVCDELAREIGEDKAEVEDLKRESAKVREEVEEERRMLQMAEVWREERVQMKLAEARLELEDKNAILDNLRIELESFLKSRKAFLEDVEDDEGSCRAAVQEAEDLKRAMDSLQLRDSLHNSCRVPDVDEELSDACEVQQIDCCLQPDERTMGGWGDRPNSVSLEYDSRSETGDQVEQRLRRKYKQGGYQSATAKGSQEGDSARKWENERDESGWNCQRGYHGDVAKEDVSQWESASDEDIVGAMQQNNSHSPSQVRRTAEQDGGSQADEHVQPSDYESMSCTQRHIAKSSIEVSSGDNPWKVATHLAGTADHQRRLSGETYKSFFGRVLPSEVSRNSVIRLVTEQGISSPCRDWRSPDRGNPHIARGIKGFIEWPKMSRENNIKVRSLESKAQQAFKQCI